MEEMQVCEHCGSKLNGRWESLTPGLVRTLIKFSESAKIKGKTSLHLQNDCNFTKNEYNNFQKLGYFTLVAKERDGVRLKTGVWTLTENGIKFLNGASIYKEVYVFQNQVKQKSEERTSIRELHGSIPYWNHAEDYVYQAPPQTTIANHTSTQGKLI